MQTKRQNNFWPFPWKSRYLRWHSKYAETVLGAERRRIENVWSKSWLEREWRWRIREVRCLLILIFTEKYTVEIIKTYFSKEYTDECESKLNDEYVSKQIENYLLNKKHLDEGVNLINEWK